MNKRNQKFGQFIFDNHAFEGTPDEFLNQTAPLIGYIVFSFNSVDELLNSIICEIINDRSDIIGSIILSKLNYSGKVELFERLVQANQMEKNSISNFKNLIKDLKKCAEFRNAIVHAEWENLNHEGYTYVKMHFDKEGLKQQYWQFTPQALVDIDMFINDTYDKLNDVLEEFYKLSR